MSINASTCKGCPNRALNCHSTCEDYKAYRAEKDRAINERARSQTYDDYVFAAKRRERRRHKK